MTPTRHPQTKPYRRRDGWTVQRRQAFLGGLAAGLDVRRACARVGLSREGAYRLRQREPEFALAWDAALRAARAEDERRFLALIAEKLPWMLPAVAGEGGGRESDFLPQDGVTCVSRV